jgi:hypothetical protein
MALPIKVKSGLSHSHVGKYFATALLTVRYTIFNKCHREAGVTTWGLEEKSKSIAFWDRALSYTKYDFEYRLTLVSYFARFQHHDQTTYICLKRGSTLRLRELWNKVFNVLHRINQTKGQVRTDDQECQNRLQLRFQ